MDVPIACIAGKEVYRQWDAGHIRGRKIGSRPTPFGQSAEMFLVEGEGQAYYLMPRQGLGMAETSPFRINSRANLYALKDLGVRGVLAWGPGAAVTHSIAVGDLVILSDVIDRTYLRPTTFFPDGPLGLLRAFPVFCPSLRRAAGEAIDEMKLIYHGAATAAVTEGPRLETPAEVRMFGAVGVQVVTHSFVPEVFLAKELELCYAAVCYVVNYAEMGSRHRPFATGDLFGGLTQRSDGERLACAVGAMGRTAKAVADQAVAGERDCDCGQTMAAHRSRYALSDDWHEWFPSTQLAAEQVRR